VDFGARPKDFFSGIDRYAQDLIQCTREDLAARSALGAVIGERRIVDK
jgi:hypothetical protein